VETGARIGLLDVRTGAMRQTVTLPDSLVSDADPLHDGWAWIPGTKDRIRIERAGKTSEIAKPAWFGQLDRLAVDRKGERVAMIGWNAGTYDSIGVAVAPLAGGQPVLWTAEPAELGDIQWLSDGALLFSPWDTPESIVWFKLTGPAQGTRLGRISRPSAGASVSDDLKRVAVVERNYHGDAFSSRIVRR
jgi:hypothetical protein